MPAAAPDYAPTTPVAVGMCSRRTEAQGLPRDQPPVAILVHPRPQATSGQVQSPWLWHPLECHCHSPCAGSWGVVLLGG